MATWNQAQQGPQGMCESAVCSFFLKVSFSTTITRWGFGSLPLLLFGSLSGGLYDS